MSRISFAAWTAISHRTVSRRKAAGELGVATVFFRRNALRNEALRVAAAQGRTGAARRVRPSSYRRASPPEQRLEGRR